MQTTKHRSIIGFICIGLMSVLLVQRLASTTLGAVQTFSSPLPSPPPRATVYGWSGPPPAPTIDPNSTPTQRRSARPGPHSPLPTPTPIPDFMPPQTTMQINGIPTTTHWYRSPVSVTFTITDNFFAGVTEYQLDQAPNWTSHEYYYPPLSIQAEGVHTLTYRSIDIVRNVEAPQTAQIRIDRTPPQVAVLAVDSNQLLNGWYNTPVQVTFTGSDALSGLAGFAQQTTDATWVDSPAGTTLATTGNHALTWRAVDNAGNVSAAQQTTVQVDVTPPTTTATLDAVAVNGWYTRSVTVTLTAIDVGAGVFQTQYHLNGEAGWRSYSGPFPVSGVGAQTVVYQSIDRALNTEISHTLTLPIDLAPPLLTASVSPTQTSHSWYRQAVSVTLHAQDAQAGLDYVEYALDGVGWQPYTTPLTVRPGAAHTVQFRALDRAGHAVSTDLLTVGVDGQPPTTTLLLSQAPNAAGWLNQPVTLTLVATDTETGVFQTQSQWQHQASTAIYQQPLRLVQEGQPTLTWFSIDRALNQEPAQTRMFHLDLTPPVITYTISGGSPLGAVAPGWYQTAATVQVTATDALAGVAGVEVALDGGGWQPYTGPLTITSGGQHTLQFQADDQAGNRQLLSSTAFGIDTLPPLSTVWLDGGRAANGWYVTPVTVTLTTTDTGAGVATLQSRLNGGLWQSYTGPFVVTSEWVNLLEYAALDKAGNQEAQKFTVFSLDLQNPTSQAVIVQGRSGSDGWYVSPVVLTFTGQDLESGLSHVEYQLDQQPWQTVPGPIELASEGVHHLAYRARDATGRVDATHTLTVAIDLTPPQIETTLSREVSYSDFSLSGLYTVTDSVSPIVTMTVHLNGAPYLPNQPLLLGENLVEISAVNGAGLLARQVQPIFVRGATLYLPLISHK